MPPARESGAAVLTGSSPTMTTDRPVPAAPDPDIDRVRDVLRNIPGLRADALAVSRLPGGLTNRNHLVETPHRVVVRLSSEQAALLAIDREAEWANSVAAAAAGVAPAVLGDPPTGGAPVIEGVGPPPLTPPEPPAPRAPAGPAGIRWDLHAPAGVHGGVHPLS